MQGGTGAGVERLGDERIQRFLAAREVAVLATLQPDGGPLAMPMWFLPDPDAITMISVDGLQKVRNLRRDGRVCVVAEEGRRGPLRGVIVQGRAELLAPSPERDTLVARLLSRYAPDLERLWGQPSMPASRVLFRIRPRRVRSWGLG